jgi:hypothetical protein
MAKKRTKKDRVRAHKRLKIAPIKPIEPKVQTTLIKTSPLQKKSFFSQDPDMIKTDLKKTLLVTLFILLVLFTIALLYT